MQFDIDISGEHSELFIRIRDILLDFDEIKEVKNAKQTSYKDSFGVVVMMRSKGNILVLSFGKGAQLQEKYSFLTGDGLIVRHWNLYRKSDFDEEVFRKIIEESMILNMEYHELKKLRRKNEKNYISNTVSFKSYGFNKSGGSKQS
jgi:hypothetical protein